MSDWQISRLSASKPRKLIETLPGLYDVDVSAFKKDDQYGLDLIRLALLQPEAFWVAALDKTVVGYLSMFSLRNDRLYKKLAKSAGRGTLDLPKLIGDYGKDLASTLDSKLCNVHFYVDAIAVTGKHKGITTRQVNEVRKDLLQAARNDLAWVSKGSLCLIAVRPGISHLIKKVGIPLKHIGGRRESVTGDKKYRELFCQNGINAMQLKGIMDGLAFLRNVRFGLRFAFDQLKGTPTVDVFVEPKD